jgi:hypothetical protein
MIKFIGGNQHRQVVGLGLSHRNLELLRQGKLIMVNLRELGVDGPPHEVMIFAGETEEAMTADLRSHGMIGPDTITHWPDDP